MFQHLSARMGLSNLFFLVLLLETAYVAVECIEPNYPEIHDAQSESNGAKVDISQESPNSNTIHVAHNIPKNSDISLKQVRKYQTFFCDSAVQSLRQGFTSTRTSTHSSACPLNLALWSTYISQL
jgi:hypothetical protein